MDAEPAHVSQDGPGEIGGEGCLFRRIDAAVFEATELTRGPWDPGAQHAAPPSALLGEAIAGQGGEGRSGWHVGRINYEILSPVPIAKLQVATEVIRPGRSVELVEATLTAPESRDPDRALVQARAWRLRGGQVRLPAHADPSLPDSHARQAGRPGGDTGQPRPPEQGSVQPYFPGAGEVGYHTAMEIRFLRGGFDEPGPGFAWMRPRVSLIAGEETSQLARVLLVADSGNGVSSPLDIRTHVFINVDLTVRLHRLPVGEWIGMDALSIAEPSGVGVSDSALFDLEGPIGRAGQTLLIAAR